MDELTREYNYKIGLVVAGKRERKCACVRGGTAEVASIEGVRWGYIFRPD